MAITAILSSKLDNRSNGDDCTFNGYLEDYLNMEDTDLDPVLREAFAGIQANAVDTRIGVGLRSEINNDAISNQIIRYKDVFKLNGKPLIYPYILYVQKDEEERALLVVPYTKYGFIKAKGLYYCMTEPGSEFIDCKNEIVAMREMWGLQNGEHILHTAHRTTTSRAAWERLKGLLDDAGIEHKDAGALGLEKIVMKETGGRIDFRTRTGKGDIYRVFLPYVVVADEMFEGLRGDQRGVLS